MRENLNSRRREGLSTPLGWNKKKGALSVLAATPMATTIVLPHHGPGTHTDKRQAVERILTNRLLQPSRS